MGGDYYIGWTLERILLKDILRLVTSSVNNVSLDILFHKRVTLELIFLDLSIPQWK